MPQSFFLDIFNNILDYENNDVKITFDKDGEIWFAYNDILSLLGYKDVKTAIKDFSISTRYTRKFSDICTIHNIVPKNFQKHTVFINESGLYEILTRSRKQKAQIFLNKYTRDIMPKIRKTGRAVVSKTDKTRIDKLNSKIKNLQHEIKSNNKYTFLPSTNGYLYICQNTRSINGTITKCYKIGYAIDMKKRMSVYKVGNFNHSILGYIPLVVDRKQIESCIKTRLKPHLMKLFTDTVCYISLKKLKEEIMECIDFTYNHVCHCLHCSKIYDLKTIDRHICNAKKMFVVPK